MLRLRRFLSLWLLGGTLVSAMLVMVNLLLLQTMAPSEMLTWNAYLSLGMLTMGAIAIPATIGAYHWLQHHVITPLKQYERALATVRHGNLEPALKLDSTFTEIGVLGECVNLVMAHVRDLTTTLQHDNHLSRISFGALLSVVEDSVHLNQQLQAMTAELEASRQQYQRLTEAVPTFVWTSDPDGFITYTSPQIMAFTGAESEDLLGEKWLVFVHPEDLVRLNTSKRRSLETQEPYEAEFRLWEAQTASYRWFLSRATPFRDAYGTVTHWYGTTTDIHTTKETQQALRDSESRYRTLVDVLAEGVFLSDRNGCYHKLNASAEQILGLDTEALRRYRTLPPGWQWLRPDGSPLPEAERPDLLALSRGIPQLSLMVGLDAPQRERRWILHNSLPLTREGEALPYAAVTSMTDVTARIQAEERLKRSLDELECANAQLRNLDRYKDQFLSSVSHELRGPLSLISGFGSMLSEELAGPLSDTQREYVWGVMDAAESLTALVNDLLDLGAIQAGRFTIHRHVFCFEDLLASVAIKHGILAETKGQTLTFDAPPDLPELYADAQRLRQILSNLLTNALKYTPEGGRIHVRAWQESETLRCEVTDTGIGISPSDQQKLFGRFIQVHQTNVTPYRGAGLGLSIVKALVEAHGGEIGVRSRLGTGSTFWFTLPFGVAPTAEA
ncbi:Non-motile and phage-resistance protein [compost metagenome]